MIRPRVLLGLAGVIAFASITGAAELVQIAHSPLDCVPKEVNAKVTARITGPSAIASGRVYFRTEAKGRDNYLEMRHDSDHQYWAVLPLPAGGTEAVVYRIVAQDANGQEATTEVVTAPVTTSCPATPLTDEERRYASHLVIGLTAADQLGLPTGFLCKGIVSQITASGQLQPNGACLRKALTVARTAAAEPGPVWTYGTRSPSLENPVSSARPTSTSPR